MRFLLLMVTGLFLTSCATTQTSPNIERWKAQKNSEEFKQEKQTYRQRLGADICWGTGVGEFLTNTNLTPSKECVYPASKMIVEREDEEATFMKGNKTLKQNIKQLKVFQVVPDGFVVETPHSIVTTHQRGGSYFRTSRPINTIIFVHKTDEKGVVDGSFLDDNHYWNLYEYSGPYTYQTNLGSKTVHSFKKVSTEKLLKASEGLKSYGPRRELFIEHELWDRMEELEKEKR
jgi:hypothetical protein